jgi:hypothetical protein
MKLSVLIKQQGNSLLVFLIIYCKYLERRNLLSKIAKLLTDETFPDLAEINEL